VRNPDEARMVHHIKIADQEPLASRPKGPYPAG